MRARIGDTEICSESIANETRFQLVEQLKTGPSASLVDYRAWAPGLVWVSVVPAVEGAQPLCSSSLLFCSGIKIATCA